MDIEGFLTNPGITRRLLPLKPGEPQPPPDLLNWTPEGFRWETDDELRQRILEGKK